MTRIQSPSIYKVFQLPNEPNLFCWKPSQEGLWVFVFKSTYKSTSILTKPKNSLSLCFQGEGKSNNTSKNLMSSNACHKARFCSLQGLSVYLWMRVWDVPTVTPFGCPFLPRAGFVALLPEIWLRGPPGLRSDFRVWECGSSSKASHDQQVCGKRLWVTSSQKSSGLQSLLGVLSSSFLINIAQAAKSSRTLQPCRRLGKVAKNCESEIWMWQYSCNRIIHSKMLLC